MDTSNESKRNLIEALMGFRIIKHVGVRLRVPTKDEELKFIAAMQGAGTCPPNMILLHTGLVVVTNIGELNQVVKDLYNDHFEPIEDSPTETDAKWHCPVCGEPNDEACCNQECQGSFGTGCWHCHDPMFFKESDGT